MRNVVFIVMVIVAFIVVALYVKRIHTVPVDVRSALGDSVKTMQQVPDAVRAKVNQDLQTGDKRLRDAMKETSQ